MKGASSFIYDTKNTKARLEKARGEYLEKRAELSEAYQEAQELRKTLSDSRRQATVSSEQAEASIRDARGKETAEAVEMQEMAIRKERQGSVLERMIADQESSVELLQIDTYGARVAYDRFLTEARWEACHNEIKKQAENLFSSEAASPLLRLLPTLGEKAMEGVMGSSSRLFRYGIDGEMTKATGTPPQPLMTSSEQKEAEQEARNQQMIAIGELVYPHIEKPDFDAVSELDNLLQPIEPLGCEQSGEKWGNSGIAVSRRRKELLSLLGEPAA